MFSQLFFCIVHRKRSDSLGNCVPLPTGLPKKSALNVAVPWLWPLSLSGQASNSEALLPRVRLVLSYSLLPALETTPEGSLATCFLCFLVMCFFQLLERHLIKSEEPELQSQLYRFLTHDP